MKLTFAYLSSFSGAGGIERYNKCFMKALVDGGYFKTSDLTFLSMNDTSPDSKYVQSNICFKGFSGNKWFFTFQSFFSALRADVLVLGHVNVSLVYLLAKFFKPSLKCVLIVHGVEVWREVSPVQLKALKSVSMILTVSKYTAQTLNERYSIDFKKIKVINNMIDPYIVVPESFQKNEEIIDKHKLKGKKVILTVCRIRKTEKDKGYDKVIQVIPALLKEDEDLVYLLVGKYDVDEKLRLDILIRDLNISDKVLFSGYVSDNELEEYYKLADIFVMPSKKEGFGIVFIEALLNGLFVIAGNKDGSVDALDNGNLGILIDPDDSEALKQNIQNCLALVNRHTLQDKKDIQSKTLTKFSFDVFKKLINEFLNNEIKNSDK